MLVWSLGMRLRVTLDAAFGVVLGLTLILQSPHRQSRLADRLREQHWTPSMVGCVLLVLGLVLVLAAVSNLAPLAAISCIAGFIAFAVLTIVVWPHSRESYIFPLFTGYIALNQACSVAIMARDRGTA